MQQDRSTLHDAAYFDGACEPRNPGGAMSGGWVVRTTDGQHVTGSGAVVAAPANSNNVAEYRALVACLKAYLRLHRPGPLFVYGDSKLVINQVTGEWQCKADHLLPLLDEARALCSQVPGGVTLSHIPREHNTEADALSVKALAKLGIHRREKGSPTRGY